MAGSAWPIAAIAASWPSHMASIAEESCHASRSAKRGSTSSVAMYFVQASSNAELCSLFIIAVLAWQGKPPSRHQQCAGGRIRIRRLQARTQIRCQPRRNGFRQAPHQREPLDPPRQEQIQEVADRVRRAFDDAAANRI